jgi:nucleotide-binding universal stress UspA family protein
MSVSFGEGSTAIRRRRAVGRKYRGGRHVSQRAPGCIYQEILEEAHERNADLTVMRSHRPQRHAVRTYLLGSNAGHVVRYATCSVLVVRN